MALLSRVLILAVELLSLWASGGRCSADARPASLNPTISLKTVRNHVSNSLAKLQVADRAQAMDVARKAGLGATS